MLSQDLRHWQARIVSLVMLGHFQEVRRRRKRPQPRVERSGERSGTLGTDTNTPICNFGDDSIQAKQIFRFTLG